MSIRKIQVLVVEDDGVSAQVARAMLERLGCQADTVANGAEAIQLIREEPYDLILMGWQVPLKEGFLAAARIRSMPWGHVTPIVGTTPGIGRTECLAAGINDLMPKPFLLENLKLALSKWTHWDESLQTGSGC